MIALPLLVAAIFALIPVVSVANHATHPNGKPEKTDG